MSSRVLSKVFSECRSGIGFATLMVVSLHFCVFTAASNAFAYASSQESQWEADIKEAKARAKDFEKHQARLRRATEERESAAHEIKRERERDEARLEKARADYSIWKKNQPSPEKEEMRLEREHLKMLAAEAREQDRQRESFIVSRDRVRRVLRKEAYINEAVEYDVRSAKSIEEQRQNPQPHLLKFDVKKSSEIR